MSQLVSEVIICALIVSSVGILVLVNKWLINFQTLNEDQHDYNWILHGLQNIVGYSTVLFPSYIIYSYVCKIHYFDKTTKGCFSSVMRKCFADDELLEHNTSGTSNSQPRTLVQDAVLLLFYFIGLQVSFLTWGILQEKVVTRKYMNSKGEVGHFTDSQFLVFVNRILAFIMSGIILLCSHQPRHKAPLYKYMYCSLSNILSSWCQYEALKFVSFPHQVLAKAAKVIPVMIMGKLVSHTTYQTYEYLTTGILSSGMLFFMLNTENDYEGASTITTFSGAILLCLYIVFDSFTSNWQGELFKRYGMSAIQMMCAINFFSCIFTAVSLLQHGGFVTSFNFLLKYPAFVFECTLLSICSAGGQLFIFRTIATFGPLVFAIISTIRQGGSVLLSCIIYNHHIPPMGILGILLIFFSIFLRLYFSYKKKALYNHAPRRTVNSL